jgi:enoyl-[acyl-carrier protein] reductase II
LGYGHKLASAVSNAGGLGLIGAGSIPKYCVNTFRNVKKETSKPLVNVPMLYPNIEEIMKIIVEEGENRFTSGNPKTWTPYLKRKNGITAALKQQMHLTRYAIVAKGHNGRDETTTFTLMVKSK